MIRYRFLTAAVCALLAAAPALAAPPADDSTRDAKALADKIDKLIAERWAKEKVTPAPAADDAEFLRRATLDLAGRIPLVSEVRTFLADPAPDKRARAIERLLKGPGYVNHFANTWQKLLVPENDPTNFELLLNVPPFQAWVRRQFSENVPYDKMVRELLTAPVVSDGQAAIFRLQRGERTEPSPMLFYLAKEAKPEELAAATSRLFLGVKLECAQCHNHPFAKWRREQFWETAAFFAGLSRDTNRFGTTRELTDRREMAIPGTDRVVQANFLDGSEPRWKYKVGPRVTLAEWVTSADNPFFARAAANRLWAHFFGIGIVDPVDDLGDDKAEPSHPELLDVLAREFAAHKFDLKFLIRAITLSKTYQLTSAYTDPSQEELRLFAKMPVKGMTAEQLFDSVSAATGYREQGGPQNPFFGANTPRSEFLTKFASQDKRTESTTSILQALALMNGKLVADATNAERSVTLAGIADAPFLDTAGKVEALYLGTLSRLPRSQERERFVKYIEDGGAKKDRKQALADVFWALLNSSEFMLNH
ncbi:MAG TPA: DUF1549 and DUF1553 domain-containing protein [Gemmataceae bacterium]|nr:DUF1549 and DUF1553 domain-containing protein [Gemmataceae bacterium]